MGHVRPVFCMAGRVWLVAGMQYEPDTYQPRGQLPTLTTGVVSSNTSASMEASTNELQKCQKLA